jgi:hypothetical protein
MNLRARVSLGASLFGLLLTLAAMAPLPAAAEGVLPASYRGTLVIPQTATPPAIDGTLTDPVWKSAAVARLDYDLRAHQPATEETTAYLIADATYLYVGVRARQSTPVRATQHTNDVGLDTNDEFQIDLWPNGTRGFRYKFTSTPIGTHYEFSTENNSFEPTWSSVGRVVPGGFEITMRIPFAVMHDTGSGSWQVQMIRYVVDTGTPMVWSFGPTQSDFNDVNYSGFADGLPHLAALRQKPRVGVYGLGEVASKADGGSTSRVGADLSVPLFAGTSFVGTIHPDFSDVEVDQQTIAPTAFVRVFNEVRPFFTQGANFYDYPNGQCIACNGMLEFYTPNVPTPRDGYAVEGQRGLFSYAALDAVGALGRNDSALSADYTTLDQKSAISFERTMVSLPGLRDDITGFKISEDDLKHFTEYVRYADDSGTNVLDGTQAQRYEAGVEYYTPTANVGAVVRKVGAYFDPVDGIIQHPDIAGYDINAFKAIKYSPKAPIIEVDLSGNIDRYHARDGALDQSDSSATVTFSTRTLFGLGFTTGSSYLLLGPGDFSPITQSGMQLVYDGNSNTPTSVLFQTGRFGPGRLDSWLRSTTMRFGPRGLLSFELDDTDQFADSRQRYTQWLERASFGYQASSLQSFAIGVRRVIGTAPQLAVIAPFQSAWNVSAALHRRFAGGELYAAYGDASAFSTAPQFIIKIIKYIGADKGT